MPAKKKRAKRKVAKKRIKTVEVDLSRFEPLLPSNETIMWIATVIIGLITIYFICKS